MKHMKHPDMEQVDLMDIMYALSDPTRLEIVRCLAKKRRPMNCGELVLNRPKSSMSHHFKILRAAGLVRTVVEGTEHMNSLRRAEVEEKFPNVLGSILKVLTRD
ncbi:MAG: metalloregulator ArsR/SmtB family transcription factor [Pseudomonadota bacterium]